MSLHLMRTGALAVNTCIVPLAGDKVFVVDPADCRFSHDEGSVVSYLASKNLTPAAVVLTHGHFDHVSGLPFIKKSFPGIPIAIHKEDAAYIGAQSEQTQGESLRQIGFYEFLPFVANLPEATAFLEDGKSLAQVFADCGFDDDTKNALAQWEVLHTSGHTQGSCCLYNKDELTLISGDTLFYQSWGRTDLPGGNERLIHRSLAKIAGHCEKETRVYPGHDHAGFTLNEM